MVNKQLFSRFGPYVLFAVIALLGFSQLASGTHPPKYDMIDCFYPWRYYIGECFQAGEFPFWNPYQDLGYPIYADPSSGAWYPPVWIIGSIWGYSIKALSFEFILHIFFAGVGFYLLSMHLLQHKKTAVILAVAYMLCGLFVGNAQHLPYVVSACWLPFVLLFYFKMIAESNWRNPIKAGFFLSLMITGGYPAFVIILFYLLLFFSIYYFVGKIRLGIKKEIWYFVGQHVVFLCFTLLLSFGLMLSIWQVSPYMSRLGNFSIEQALYSPFSPQSFISFLYPYATIAKTDFFDSDLSMRNAYFGLIPLLFFLVGNFKAKPFQVKVLYFFGLFCLMAAVGSYLPIRGFLFKYVPMMNVFRFPSVFRLFFILSALITAGIALKQYFEDGLKKQYIILTTSVLFVGSVLLIFVARNQHALQLRNFFNDYLYNAFEFDNFWQPLGIHTIFQSIFLLTILLVLWRVKDKRKLFYGLLTIVCFDMILVSQLNSPYTVYYDHISASEAQNNIPEDRKGFPQLSNISIDSAGRLPQLGQPYWQNVNDFHKEITAEGFNSFSFTNYDGLEANYPALFHALKKNQIIELGDSIWNLKTLDKMPDSSIHPKLRFFEAQEYKILSKFNFHHSKKDVAELIDYSGNNFAIKTTTSAKQLLHLFQKNYRGWKALVDGKEVPIYTNNMNFMSIVLPPGQHLVEFKYTNPSIKWAFFISLFFLLITGPLLYFLKRKNC